MDKVVHLNYGGNVVFSCTRDAQFEGMKVMTIVFASKTSYGILLNRVREMLG